MPIAVTLLMRTFICLLVFFLVFDGAALAQGGKVALVIGVSKYKNVPPLANTANDADSIGAAAKKRDRAGVMKALGTTLQMCTGCHQTFRQRVVDDATWTSLTSSPVPIGHHPGG